MQLNKSLLITLALTLLTHHALAQDLKPQKYNVLFIISDDMRAECGCYGGLAKTPNIDKLAASSVRFDRANCQFALCNPSRASMLTGHYPTNTTVLGNRTDFRTAHPDWVSLPQLFKQNGYASLRAGKVFHGGIDDPKAWSEGADQPGADSDDRKDSTRAFEDFEHAIYADDNPPTTSPSRPGHDSGPMNVIYGDGSTSSTTQPDSLASHYPTPADRNLEKSAHSDRWVVLPGDGGPRDGNRVATRTIEYLNRFKDKPFFIGCGFSEPHSPPTAPESFYELYDLDKIPLPPDYAVRPTVWPGFPVGSIRPRNADLFVGRDSNPQSAREVIRAYIASISWVDSNVGKVLDELDRLHLRDKTIIIFTADHGYQLGEKGKWSKAGSVWEQGARIPFIMYVPKAIANGKVVTHPVEMVDLYPTLTELCGLPQPPQGLEGKPLTPLLNDASAPWPDPAYTVWSEDGKTFTATAVRTDQYRYAEFTAGTGGAMLIDEKSDPHEMKNLADDPAYAKTRAELSGLVKTYVAKFHAQP
jgi:arylsulfatase A-like enzyme